MTIGGSTTQKSQIILASEEKLLEMLVFNGREQHFQFCT
jgi:hypothetical protein